MRNVSWVLVCVLLGTSGVVAQSGTAADVWTVNAEAARGKTENGGTWRLSANTGTLTLEQKGSAINGSWKGRLPETWPLTGQLTGDTIELKSAMREVPAVKDGAKTTVPRRLAFRGTVKGDTMTGQLSFESDRGDGRSQKFTATRQPPAKP